jgi:hypothetical protein
MDFSGTESGKGTLVFPATLALGLLLLSLTINAIGSGSNKVFFMKQWFSKFLFPEFFCTL